MPTGKESGAVSAGGALMVCGTASGVGKSRVVTGLCRVLARREVRVAPFKALNMSLNSVATRDGHEIARSQWLQAVAARTEPTVEMGPVLLKPTGEGTSQLVVMGRPAGEVGAERGWEARELLAEVVMPALDQLRQRFDVVVIEGSGGAAEINLLDRDIANLPLAKAASVPAVLVGDIEPGGVFASLFGTVMLLPEELRAQLRGFVINKLRGHASVLAPGVAQLERLLGLPSIGVLPHLGPLGIDEEDSLPLTWGWRNQPQARPATIDVAVIAFPHMSNFTDFAPLALEDGVSVRYIGHPGQMGDPDLLVLPGSKATVADLEWLRNQGFGQQVVAALDRRTVVLGICAGYQMLGTSIYDQVESAAGKVSGLGLLPVSTVFSADKTTLWRQGSSIDGQPVQGFEIHHGQPKATAPSRPWFLLGPGSAGEGMAAAGPGNGVWATSLHGLFENDRLRERFLAQVAARRDKPFEPSEVSFQDAREQMVDRLADTLEAHLDMQAIGNLIAEARQRTPLKGRHGHSSSAPVPIDVPIGTASPPIGRQRP
ncbi:MAG: cobyric acid synthase [Acidimicrobiales bacterium]